MTRKEKIAEAARKYATHPTDTDVTDFHGKWVKETKYNHDEYLAFLEGSQWADNHPKSPWISVEDDLPCNHEELLMINNQQYSETFKVFATNKYGDIWTDCMINDNGEWRWHDFEPAYWMIAPKLPK